MLIYFFGNTVPPKKTAAVTEKTAGSEAGKLAVTDILQAAKQKLSPEKQAYVNGLETAVVRGAVKEQQINNYRQLAGFWKDSSHFFEPYAYYTAEAAKLENSEKSLTFAARVFLNELKGTNQPQIKQWMADQAKVLFEKALAMDPANDSLKIGLGSCYIFGSSAASPQEVMTGIQQILEVAKRDSTNMYAQLMLGIGGVVSGQLDKAVERLTKVAEKEPGNMEALFMLAEAYERKGDNAGAIHWYEASKKYISGEQMIKEIDQKIKSLK
jgi:Tfp pilus assembly protein PilF